MTFTLADLTEIARETIGDGKLVLSGTMAAADVPGWDSLNHTLITLEIGALMGVEIEPPTLAGAQDFAELVDLVNGAAVAG